MIQLPTTHLPPITKIADVTTKQLVDAVGYLGALYRPQVRGSRRRRRGTSQLYPSCDDHDHDDDLLGSDAFERAYAIRWLTALISQLELHQELDPVSQTLSVDDDDTRVPIDTSVESDRDRLVQQAASLLATCAGVAASGKVHRKFIFQLSLLVDSVSCFPTPSLSPAYAGTPTPIPDAENTAVIPIHVTLTDIPLDNHDYASVGAQTWGGACVLAEMIAERPDRFGLIYRPFRKPLRILELGAGTGLVGLTVAKVLQTLGSTTRDRDTRATTIVLTDFYPAVLTNLQFNIDANFPTTPDDSDAHAQAGPTIRVVCHPLDWSSLSMTTPAADPKTETHNLPSLLSTPFDLVFGADIIYETQHALWIRDCLKSLLARTHPDSTNEPMFHLVIPLRPTHTFESSTVEEVFGRTKDGRGSEPRELVILEKESIVCEAYGDGGYGRRHADEDVEYVYYRIGWSH